MLHHSTQEEIESSAFLQLHDAPNLDQYLPYCLPPSNSHPNWTQTHHLSDGREKHWNFWRRTYKSFFKNKRAFHLRPAQDGDGPHSDNNCSAALITIQRLKQHRGSPSEHTAVSHRDTGYTQFHKLYSITEMKGPSSEQPLTMPWLWWGF